MRAAALFTYHCCKVSNSIELKLVKEKENEMKRELKALLIFSAAALALSALLIVTAGCNLDLPFSRWSEDTGTVSLSVGSTATGRGGA